MKKKFTVTAYEAYDYTEDLRLGDSFPSLYEAQEKIRLDDKERRKHDSLALPFKHHDYAIIEWVDDVEIDVEDEEEEPSFCELCKAVKNWRLKSVRNL